MRTLPLCLASMSLSLLAGCVEPDPNATEIWDIEAAPRMCEGEDEYFYFCAQYTLDGTDETRTLTRDIGGLDETWGHSYRVEVEIIDVVDESQGSSIRYELVELIDEETHPGLEFDLSLQRNVVEFDADGESGIINNNTGFSCTPEQCADLDVLFDDFVFVDAVFRFGPDDNRLFPLELVSFAADEG